MAMTLLGIDVGTSLIKASFVDDRAQPIASVERSLPIHIPGVGVAEQDAPGLIRLLAEMLRELTERDPESARSIVAIGVSAQTAGSMAVDRDGEAISPWFPSAMDPARNRSLIVSRQTWVQRSLPATALGRLRCHVSCGGKTLRSKPSSELHACLRWRATSSGQCRKTVWKR